MRPRSPQHLGTNHQRFEVTPSGVDVIDQLVWHYDEPFGDSSAVPTWYLSELTRKEVTVALSGDGGDELFAGYDRYQALWLSNRLQKVFPIHKIPGIGLVQRLPDSNKRRSMVRRAKRFFEAIGATDSSTLFELAANFSRIMRASLYTDDFVASLPGDDPFDFLDAAWQRIRRSRCGDAGIDDRLVDLFAVRLMHQGRHRVDGSWIGSSPTDARSPRRGVRRVTSGET